MGRGEHPALMMDSANCSPALVSHTYLLPNNLPSAPNYSYFHSWWQLYVSISETKTEEVGLWGTAHLQPGWDAGSGCLPALCHPAGMQELVIDNRLSLLQLWGSPGAKMQRQHTPGVRTGRPGHRCSTRALCGVEWHIAASLMAVSLSAGAGRKRVTMLRTL